MVLYKRKPVVLDSGPAIADPDTEIWVMPETDEIYTSYESFLDRYNFLSQKRFTDAVNGKSGMTYFDAVTSESQSSTEIDRSFPEPLREPVLRKVQFQTIGRIDDLVNLVYEEYKDQFFPGEQVTALLEDGDQEEGVIREKAIFPELRLKDGSIIRPPFDRFFVRLNDRPEEALLDQDHIKRGRNIFSKQHIRSFLKASLQREAWTGAPWLVKEPLAIKYRISMQIPPHLQQEARQRQRQSSLHHLGSSATASPAPADAKQNGEKGRSSKKRKTRDFDIDLLTQPRGGVDGADIKHVVNDLNLRPRAGFEPRPRLNFLAPLDGSACPKSGLRMSSVGSLLEIWNTLNVHCEIYTLDSFTFDDFLDAMKFSSADIKCELLEEIHCAALKQLVNTDGEVQVTLPEPDSDDESLDESDHAEQNESSSPEPRESGRKSRLSVVENASELDSSQNSKRSEHRAHDLLTEFDWIENLKTRNFSAGGWQSIMVGVLQRLALPERSKTACDAILAYLCPLDRDASPATVKELFATMDINLRISALEKILFLTLTTKAVRSYLETCSEDMTETRKLKLEQSRKKKEFVAKIRELEEEKREQNLELPEEPNKEETMDESLATNGDASSDGEDEDTSRSLRRGTDRALQRKRKRDEETARKERERIERAGAARLSADQMKKYKKIVREIEVARKGIIDCEEQLNLCDRDLREANCQRTMMLGMDRFYNRYWWFERNGMPFGGLPDSSTAEYGYANARIWVQGPDDSAREGFFQLDKKDMDAYVQTHGMTVLERKDKEEGQTHLSNAGEWGYYDDPDEIGALDGWLDEYGRREGNLLNEMNSWRYELHGVMGNLKRHLEQRKRVDDDSDESPIATVSTRHKTYVDVESSGQTVLKWKNGAALRDLGHLHSERPQKGRGRTSKGGRGVAVPVQQSKNGLRTTRSGSLR